MLIAIRVFLVCCVDTTVTDLLNEDLVSFHSLYCLTKETWINISIIRAPFLLHLNTEDTSDLLKHLNYSGTRILVPFLTYSVKCLGLQRSSGSTQISSVGIMAWAILHESPCYSVRACDRSCPRHPPWVPELVHQHTQHLALSSAARCPVLTLCLSAVHF